MAKATKGAKASSATKRKPRATKTSATKTASKAAAPKPTATLAGAKAPVRKPPVPAAKVVSPAVVSTSAAPKITGPVLRKKELVDIVTEKSGKKRRDVKPVVEALLAALGDALANDREMNLPPFGKLRIQRVKQTPSARVTVAKLRQAKPKAAPAPLTAKKDDTA